MKKKVIVDLFAGAGGESTGIMQAVRRFGLDVDLIAVNHWDTAINTHSLNHPHATHYCESIKNVDPCKAIPGGHVDILWASPECTHHSNAAGGRPKNAQSRASVRLIMDWLKKLDVDRIFIENVQEFLTWGPLYKIGPKKGKPIESRKGEYFRKFIRDLSRLGYSVEWRKLCAADFGAPTIRTRLFIQAAKRGKADIIWPNPSHSREADLFTTKKWIPARDIIDFSLPAESIFNRKKPLAEATLKRIEIGIERFWGDWAEPFLCILRGTGTVRKLTKPLPALTAGGQHIGLVEPFITRYNGGDDRNHSIDNPLPVVDCSNRYALVEGHIDPLILHQMSGGMTRPVEMPLPTVTTKSHHRLIAPFIYASGHRSSVRVAPLDFPLSTIVTKAEHCLVVPYYGNGQARPDNLPLPTVTCKDRFALIEGCVLELDIRFRMLQPQELAEAQGFPKGYKFAGNKSEKVKQIGNAVPPVFPDAFLSAIFEDEATDKAA